MKGGEVPGVSAGQLTAGPAAAAVFCYVGVALNRSSVLFVYNPYSWTILRFSCLRGSELWVTMTVNRGNRPVESPRVKLRTLPHDSELKRRQTR